MTIETLEMQLRGACLEDLLVPGYVDEDDTPVRFRSLPLAVYVQLSSALLELAVVETTGTLRVSLVRTIPRLPGLEEDMVMAVTSLREQTLRDVDGRNEVTALRLWGAANDGISVTCAAAQFELGNGQQIFIDPTNHFGIRVGASDQRQAWRDAWPGASEAPERVLRLG